MDRSASQVESSTSASVVAIALAVCVGLALGAAGSAGLVYAYWSMYAVSETRELAVELPASSVAMPLTARPKELFIRVEADGTYFVADQALSTTQLEVLLRNSAERNPVGQTVIIRADKRVPLDPVVAVMNACNKAGIRDYMLTTQGGE